MSRTAAEVVCAYFADYDGGDDDEGFVLASDVGGRINSYTGSHGWFADARHALPPIEPALKQAYYAFQNAYRDYQLSTGTAVDPWIMETGQRFLGQPGLRYLMLYANAVAALCRVPWLDEHLS